MQQNITKSAFLITAITIALMVLTACRSSNQDRSADQDGRANEPEGAAVSESSPDESELPLDFELMAYQGEEVLGGGAVQFSELLDQNKPVVLNFWAGLCPPCRVEMPEFQEVYEQHKGDILLIGVDVGTFTGLGSEEEAISLLEELDVTYPSGTTSEAEIMQAYEVVGMPSTVFISPDGEVFKSWTGALNEEKMNELVTELLEESG